MKRRKRRRRRRKRRRRKRRRWSEEMCESEKVEENKYAVRDSDIKSFHSLLYWMKN